MTPERAAQIEAGGVLTHDEMAEGWHFCIEFDGLLTQAEIEVSEGVCICGFKRFDPTCPECLTRPLPEWYVRA